MATYYSSDWHADHFNCIGFCGRPFKDVDDMRETLIANHNAVVKPEDISILIGDVALNLKTIPRLIPRLNGKKILIVGNHDKNFHLKKGAEKAQKIYDQYFDEIYTHQHRTVGDYPVYLNHFPFRSDDETERYHMQRPTQDNLKGAVALLHGHTHSFDCVKGNAIHIGVDARAYTPVSEDQIIIEIKQILENK